MSERDEATQNLIDVIRKHTGTSEDEAVDIIDRSLAKALGDPITHPPQPTTEGASDE